MRRGPASGRNGAAWAWAIAAAIALASGCASAGASAGVGAGDAAGGEGAMSGTDPVEDAAAFEAVDVGSFREAECSPVFDDDERGLRIRMPARAVLPVAGGAFEPDARLPLCMAVQMSGLELRGYDSVFEAVNVVVVDDAGESVFAGRVWRDRTRRPAQRPERSDDALAAVTLTKFYNPDLLEFAALPARAGRYHVTALLDDMKSNTCSVEVVPEGEE